MTPAPSGIDVSRFEIALNHDRLPYLQDHQVYEQPVLPTALLLESALEAGHLHFGQWRGAVESFVYHDALVVPATGTTARIVIRSAASGTAEFEIASRNGDGDSWRGHAEGILRAAGAEAAGAPAPAAETVRSRCPTAVAADVFYDAARRAGLGYGPRFRAVQQVWLGDGELIGRVQVPPATGTDALGLHPTLVDACLHTYLLLTHADNAPTCLPTGVERFVVHRPRVSDAWVHVVLRPDAKPGSGHTVDLRVLDEQSELVAEMRGLTLRELPREAFMPPVTEAVGSEHATYRLRWKRSPAEPTATERAAPT